MWRNSSIFVKDLANLSGGIHELMVQKLTQRGQELKGDLEEGKEVVFEVLEEVKAWECLEQTGSSKLPPLGRHNCLSIEPTNSSIEIGLILENRSTDQ